MNEMLRKAAAPFALVVGLGVGGTMMDASRQPVSVLDAQGPAAAARTPDGLSTAFRSASRAALPAVVRVDVQAAPRAVARRVPDGMRGTPFEEFFGPPLSPRPQAGSGSGFIISQDGYVLTNNHVVENATRVTVTLTDKREYDARVVGRDPNTDIAVLKIDAQGLPTARLGDSDAVQVGDWVLALGYPMSLGETVTAGIVSAKGKNLGIMQRNDGAQAPLEHFIQTDAAINPGNSGGPLVDLNGSVVGVNTAIASPTGSYSGYGFSVPIQLARRVADDLIRYGAVRRPRLGVQIKEVQSADAEVFGLPDSRGAVVATEPEGPARAAGIRLGDVIVAVDGAPVVDVGDLMERIARRRPGEEVRLELIRYGKRQSVRVRLGEFASEPAERSASREAPAAPERLGFEGAELTPELARQLGVRDAQGGVVVVRVDPAGPAPRELTGLRLERVNGTEVKSLRDLRAAAEGIKPGSTVSVVGRRPDGTSTIVNYRLRS